MLRCAIYLRLSKEDLEKETESESIQNQRALLLRYAGEQGWDVYQIYCDEDYSGTDRDRPAFQAMLEAARQKRFEIILCKSQSRFTRDMELVEKYLHGLFPIWGIRFVSIADQADTARRENKKARQINGLINEWYLEDLSQNIRTVLDEKRRQGKFIGSFAPYGYRKDPKDHNHLVIDWEAGEIVKLIFSWYLQGYGVQKIASMLNSQGILNPSFYKRRHGERYPAADRSSGKWSRTTVGRILKNEVYTGTLVQGKRSKPSYKSKQVCDVPQAQWIRIPDAHEALISHEEFQLVQEKLHKAGRAQAGGKQHLLAGKVFCMDCGAAMHKVTTYYKGEKRSYLRCSRHSEQAETCSGHSIRLDLLIEVVRKKMQELIAEYCDAGALERSLAAEHPSDERTQIEFRQAETQHQMHLIRQAKQELYLDKVRGDLDFASFDELKTGFDRQQAELQAYLCRIQQQLCKIEARQQMDVRQEAITDLLEQGTADRWLVEALIRKIEIGEKQSDQTQSLMIHWMI